MILRAVVDTNVIVSGLGWPEPPGAILDAALDGQFVLVTSPQLLIELRRVLGYPKLSKIIGGGPQIADLVAATSVVVVPRRVFAVVSDESDNRVVEAAVEGNADYIVTGDDDLLVLDCFEGITVVRPAKFLAILRTQTT